VKRPAHRLRLAAETVRELRTVELAVARGGWAAESDECSYTACYKYCSD
jgi:hypothetical protein